uniref:TIP120 domain-containing protein n=1 Tax=Globodera pallida TaxID=36090 RepID=A0A183C175_GLOPA
MRALQNHLTAKNMRTRICAFNVLSHLIRTFPGVMNGYLDTVIINITKTLADSSADGSMKIEILRFISLLLNTHEPERLNRFVEVVLPQLATAVGDQFYKIAGEALLTTQSLLRVLHAQKLDVSKILPIMYSAVISKLKIADIDQEVKEKNIATAGLLISLFSAELGPQITDECLPLLLERLCNEMTRQALRAINHIVQSPAKLDLHPMLPELLSLCAEFLRKNQRSLRLSTLTLLESLVCRFSHNGLQGPSLIKVVKEIPALICEQDLQIALIAVTFITNVVNSYPDQILADPLNNLFHSLLQGATLNATLSLLSALIKSPLPNKPTFKQILERIREPVYNTGTSQFLHRQTYSSIAKATATVAHSNADQNDSCALVLSLRDSFRNAGPDNDSVRLFSVLTLGELGRLCRSVFETLEGQINVESLIVEAFESQLEEIKSAASYALGSLATGNLQKATIYKEIHIFFAHLNALRFIIVEQPRPADDHLRPVMGQFLATVRDPDLNVRRVAIIKECLPNLLPALYEETKVKLELVHEVEMGPFKHIVDDGLDLRKAAFECMYTLADQSLDRVNVSEYLTYVENGLKDQHDIKLLTYLMLVRLVHKCPIQMAQRLDAFCEHIKPQLLLRPKQNAVKQENDKQDELKRSAVRAVIALRKVPNSDRWDIINGNPDLTQMKELQTREQHLWSAVNGYDGQETMEVE